MQNSTYRSFFLLLIAFNILSIQSTFADDSIPDSKTTIKEASTKRNYFTEVFSKKIKWSPLKASFSLQSDFLFSMEDQDDTYKTWRGNTYIQGTLRNDYLEIGARAEDLSQPLPGRSAIESGRGIPFYYLTARYNNFAEITLGDFYDRFGSGIIFRAYEDRALGIDNAVRGVRVALKPFYGVTLKALYGQQRYTFDRIGTLYNKSRGFVGGTDLELDISQWSKWMKNNGFVLTIGGSYVNKNEKDEDIFVVKDSKTYKLNLPLNVPAFGSRLNLGYKGFVFNTEYAYKPNDPTAENNYNYHPGSVAMFSLSYSQKGLSALLQAKRSENFNYISKRSLLGIHLHINHLPPFSAQHTYALASLYPYATQPSGEWAFQGELRYLIPRKTFLGGKYGTSLRFNFSHIRGLKKNYLEGIDIKNPQTMYGSNAYTSPFFGMGELYFNDIDFEISKKVSRNYSFIFTYMHQIYNQEVVEGHLVNPLQATPHVWSNIFIYDGSHKLSKKLTLRTEIQYLNTKHAEGDWLFGLAELSVSPNWMFAISDQFNAGVTKKHYYMAGIVYAKNAHRFQLAVGRTRAGMNCSGGVCRWMPQTKGIYFSYNGNF